MSKSLKTSEEIRKELAANGITISAWAREMGFSPGLVYQVLAGRLKCEHGQAHRIAVKLRLKEGETGEVKDLSFGGKEVIDDQVLKEI